MEQVHMSPDTEINLQVLLWLGRQCAAERYRPLREMGLRPDQITQIRHMRLEDLHELLDCIGTGGRVLSVAIDPVALDLALRIQQRRRADRDTLCRLLQAGAHYPALHDLVGIDMAGYAAYRSMLGLSGQGTGRTRRPPPREQLAIWHAWQATAEIQDLKQRYLTVHERTGAEIRAIWTLVQEWEAGADYPVEDDLEPRGRLDRQAALVFEG